MFLANICSTVEEQFTHDLEGWGLNPAASGTEIRSNVMNRLIQMNKVMFFVFIWINLFITLLRISVPEAAGFKPSTSRSWVKCCIQLLITFTTMFENDMHLFKWFMQQHWWKSSIFFNRELVLGLISLVSRLECSE